MHLALMNMVLPVANLEVQWGRNTRTPSQCPPQTCTVEVILAVGEVLQERDALCLVVVASGCLQQHDLKMTRYRALQLPQSHMC